MARRADAPVDNSFLNYGAQCGLFQKHGMGITARHRHDVPTATGSSVASWLPGVALPK